MHTELLRTPFSLLGGVGTKSNQLFEDHQKQITLKGDFTLKMNDGVTGEFATRPTTAITRANNITQATPTLIGTQHFEFKGDEIDGGEDRDLLTTNNHMHGTTNGSRRTNLQTQNLSDDNCTKVTEKQTSQERSTVQH